MIILKRRGRDAVFVITSLLIVAAILFFARKEIVDDFFRQFPPSEFGFSSRAQMEAQCSYACTKVISRSLVHKIVSVFYGDNVETLDLHISF